MEKVPTNAHAVASGGAVVTPLSPHKSLPEAVSLTNTPGRVFSTDASTTEDIAVVSSVSSFSSPTASQMSEGGLSPVVVARSEVRVEKPVVKQDKQTERLEAQAHKATPGDKVGKAFALLPPKLQAEKAKKKGLAAARPKYMRSPATSGVAQPPSVRVPSPSKHKIQLAVPRKGDKDAASTLSSSFKPLHGDFARPTSGLLSLRTTSPATTTTTTTSTASPTRLSPSKKEKTEAGEDNTDRTAKKRPSQPKQDRSDLGVAARSNPHLSALADLLDNKVFTEEDVLLELEAIRKRALLTTAPFNKHLLPILAWYLLRDKFGEDAATRYVDCLTCPPGTRRLDGAVNTTGHIASFLPRVNELRRERRETKERVRKSPTHYYAITPPSSPTEAGNLSAATTTTDGSGRLSRRRRRCTPAYDTLEDASDIPSMQTSSPRTPSCQSPASSPRDRLHLCTREQVVAERQLMKEEDRSVVDVLVDAGATRAQAKNVYTVVEASASHSALPEPSVFQPPPSSLPSPPPPTAVATESEKVVEALQGKKAIPEPLSVTEVTTRIEDTTTHAANQQKSDLLQELSSISPVSAVGTAVDGGLSVFYNDGAGGALPAVDAELAQMVNAEGHKALANGSHPREKAKKKAPHGPQNEKSTTVAGGTPDLSDIPCMLDDCVSAQTDFHQCSPDASGADCPYSYQAEPATGKDVEDKLAPNVESNESKIGTKEAKLHTMAGQAPVRPSPLLYSAIDHADRATQQTSSTHDVSSGPYDNAVQSSLLRPAKETQAPRKRGEDDSADGDTDTANARTRLARLDLSASRTTTATNVGGYSVLPDTSVATQKPASSPTTPSEDKRVPEERQLVDGGSPNRKRRNTTTTYEVTHGSTRINSNYGSLLPGGSTIDNANAAGPDLSDAASAGADYSAFEFTAPSQLAPSSPFTSRDVASSAFSSSAPGTAGGEMSAAAFSMFEQDSSLPRRRSSQRSHTARTTATNSTVTSATQDAAPYSGFFSTRGGSMNTTRRSGTPAFSILNNKISASTMDSRHDETASHRQKLSINGSAFAFGSMMEGSELQTTAQRASSARTSRSHVTQTRDSSSGFAFSEVLLSPSDAGSSIVKERIRPSRTSAPSIMGDLSQVHSRADTHYGSLMGHALSQVSAAQRRSRLAPRFSQTASTRSVSRSLSGHFLSTLTHRCSSSSSTATAESSDVSESYGSVMELQETRRRRSTSPHSPFPDSTVKPDRGDSYGSMIHNVTQTTTQEDDHNSTSEVQSPGTSRAYSAFQSQNVKETSSCRVKDQNSLLRTANAHSSVCADGTGGYSALEMDGSRSRGGAASNGGYSALAMDGSRSRGGAASNGGYSALAMDGSRSRDGAASNGGYSALEMDGSRSRGGAASNGGYSALAMDGSRSRGGAASNGGYSALAMDGSRSRGGAASNGGYSALAMDGSRSRDGAASNGGYSALAMDGSRSRGGAASNGGYSALAMDGSRSRGGAASNGGYSALAMDGSRSRDGAASNGGYSALEMDGSRSRGGAASNGGYSALEMDGSRSRDGAASNGGYSALAMDGSRSRDGAASNGGYSALAMDGSRSRGGAASNGGYSALEMSGGTADKVYSVEFSAVGVNSGCGDDICATETVSGAVPLSNGGYSVLEDRSQFHANVSSDVAAKRESQLGGSLADSTVADAVNTALKASEEKCVNTAAHRTDQHEAAACVPGQSTGGYSVLMMPDSLLKSDVLSGHAASDLPVEGICNKSSGTRSCTENNSSPVEEVATGGSNFVAARSAELSVNLPSSARDYPSVHSAAKSASHTTIADDATHSFDIYACWDSSVDGSAVNPAELQAVLKRLERPVSGLRENKACTFGEDGCRCALGGQPIHRLFSSAKPAPKTTINDEASITSPIVKAAASKTSSVPVPVDEKPKDVAQVLSSPVPVEPLQQRDVNTLPLPQDTEDKKQNKKRHALPLRPSPRAEGTPLRIGTGFNKRDSPQSSPSNPSSNPGEVSKLCMSGTTPSPYRRANGSASHPASLLDADVHMSRVTIISDPRSSNDVSMHNLPDLSTQLDALENKNNDSSTLRQLRCNPQQQHRQNTSRLAERHCELPLMAPVSILHNSTAAAVPAVVYGASNRPSDARLTPTPASVGTPRETMRSAQRTSAAVVTATQHGASVVGGLSVLCGPHATAHAPAEASVTMKQEPDQGNADDVSLRMPHDMTNVLFNGRTRDNADVTTVVSSAATFRRVATHMGRQEESHVARERSPEVLAKHANLATILASSRLDGSIVIDGHTTIVDGRMPPSRSPDPSHIGGVSSTLHNRTEDSLSVERHIVSRPRHNRSLRSNSAVSPSSSSSTESSCSSSEFSSTDEDASSAAGRDDTTLQHQDGSTTSPEVSQEACSHIAVATPRRRVLMQPQPLPASPESPRQRELSQRHHTIFDVPGVPYVESPDISTHIDRNETQEKQKKHEEFVMRWAQRGLLWQRQEREAQLWEEYHARAQAGQARAGQARAGQALEYVVVGAAGFMHHPPPPVLNARMPGQIAPQPHRRPGPMPMHDRPPMRPQRPGL